MINLEIFSILPLELLLQTIINQYLNTSYCLSLVAEKPIDCTFPVSFTYISPDENQNLTYHMLEASEKGCSDYIVQVREPHRFMIAFEEVTKLGNVRRSNRKVVFLPFEEDDIHKKQLLNILSLPETSFLANLLMILPTSNGKNTNCASYDLLTHKYVGPDNESNKPVFLDRWNSCTQKFDSNTNLFPHDMTNLYGKSFKVACFTYKPYTLLDLDTAVEPTGRDGTEIKVVQEFCRWVNCTIQVIRDDEHEWGEIYENRTGVGVLGNVVEDRADAGIAALYSWFEEYVVLDFSIPTVRTAITCVAPSPRLLGSWEVPLMPFSLNMWISLLFTFVFACVALTIAKGCSTDRVLLTTFGMLVTQWEGLYNLRTGVLVGGVLSMSLGSQPWKSQPPREAGNNWRIRSVTAWLILSGLILDNAYGGGLASVFTVPKYEPSIDTVQDLVDRKMEWGATHDAWVFSLTSSEEPLIKQLVSLLRVKTADELKKNSFTRNMAYPIEQLPAGNFAIGDYITKEALINLSLMKEDFYYEQCVVMLRKSSPYTEKISQLLGRLHESGLLLAWETQVAFKHMNYGVQLEVRLSNSRKDVDIVEPLNLGHVVGIFFIYALGVSVSIALFIIELLWYRNHSAST